MLSAPPLLLPHQSQLGAPLVSASSSLCAAEGSEGGMADEEEGISNNVFASLMPNLFSRLMHCDDTVSEQEFQKIHRLLSLARSEDDVIKGNTLISQPCDEKAQEEVQNTPGLSADGRKAQEGTKKNSSPLIKSDHAKGKENALPNDPPKRNKLSRRERSSRITTHHKPFMVDVRSFGSILNNNALGKCQKPQDVHAFWEAADEREASEAIMDKLRGRCEQKAVSGTTSLRRLGVRRKNSQRTTTRIKRFAVELPSYAQQVQSLDQEQLEEEEDATEESSFTFLSNPEFRVLNQTFEQKGANEKIQGSCLFSPLQSIKKAIDSTYLDGLSNQPEEDLDVLSDGKSPAIIGTDIGQASAHVPDTTAFMGEGPEPECNKQSVASQMVDIAQTESAAFLVGSQAASEQDRNEAESNDDGSVAEMKATPYNRNVTAKKAPFTSPTPPSNPLAVFGLRKDTVVEDMSKRRLDFDDTIDLPAPDLGLPAPVPQNTPCLQTFSTSPGSSKTLAKEEILGSAKESIIKAPVPLDATARFEQIAKKPSKPTMKRKKPVENRRNSLEGAGTSWEEGHRRSTRIKSRPLEWWRGERFLLGRVHKSLATVIGIKYSSPPPCWPKRGTRAPKFKVESYVSEDYAKYVQFAALC